MRAENTQRTQTSRLRHSGDEVAKGGGSLISGMAITNEQTQEIPPEIFLTLVAVDLLNITR